MTLQYKENNHILSCNIQFICTCGSCHGYDHDHMVIGFTTTYAPMQSVPITTKVVSSNPSYGEVHSIQHYVIKFVSDYLYSPRKRKEKLTRGSFTPLLFLDLVQINLIFSDNVRIILSIDIICIGFCICTFTINQYFFLLNVICICPLRDLGPRLGNRIIVSCNII